MKTGQTTGVLKDTEVIPTKSSDSKHKISENHERDIKRKIIDDLQLDTRSAKDMLQKEDRHHYRGDEKFNPKSFKCGSSVGYIDLSVTSEDVIYHQIAMLNELIFDVIPLSRIHPFGRKWRIESVGQTDCTDSRTIDIKNDMPHVKDWHAQLSLSYNYLDKKRNVHSTLTDLSHRSTCQSYFM